jgi:hypothetical protein
MTQSCIDQEDPRCIQNPSADPSPNAFGVFIGETGVTMTANFCRITAGGYGDADWDGLRTGVKIA